MAAGPGAAGYHTSTTRPVGNVIVVTPTGCGPGSAYARVAGELVSATESPGTVVAAPEWGQLNAMTETATAAVNDRIIAGSP